jgi:hypothetical protein
LGSSRSAGHRPSVPASPWDWPRPPGPTAWGEPQVMGQEQGAAGRLRETQETRPREPKPGGAGRGGCGWWGEGHLPGAALVYERGVHGCPWRRWWWGAQGWQAGVGMVTYGVGIDAPKNATGGLLPPVHIPQMQVLSAKPMTIRRPSGLKAITVLDSV